MSFKIKKANTFSDDASNINATASTSCPTWISHLLTAIAGGLLILSPAIVKMVMGPLQAYWPPPYTNSFGESMSFEVFRWSAILGISFIAYFTSLAVIFIIPIFCNALDMFSEKESLFEKFKVKVKRMYLLRHYIASLVTSIFQFLLIELMFSHAKPSVSNIEVYMIRASFDLIFAAAIFLVKGILLQEIAIYYHGKFLEARIADNDFALKCFRVLKKTFPVNNGNNATTRQRDPSPAGGDRQMSISSPSMSSSSYRGSYTTSNQFVEIIDSIFAGLAPYPRDNFTLEDLKPHFPLDKAQKFFEILDSNFNGDITKKEFTCIIQSIHEQKIDLDNSLLQSTNVLEQLDLILFYFVVGFLIFFNLNIFDISSSLLITTYGGVAYILKFFFENMAKDAFKSVIFVMVTHPFDVGDSITISNKSYRIKKIGLWSTSMIAEQNKLIYFQNKDLTGLIIGNNRRSKFQSEPVKVLISTKVKNKSLLDLQDELNSFVSRHSRDFNGTVFLKNLCLLNADCMSVDFDIPHRSNFQVTLQKDLRGNIFMMNFNEAAQRLNIEYGPYNWDPQIKLI